MKKEIISPKNSSKKKKIIGRGTGSGKGRTSTKGHKGQKVRSGRGKTVRGFEGGQMPLVRRLPKVGFSNERHEESFFEVSIKTLVYAYKEGEEVSMESLRKKGIVDRKTVKKVKILGSKNPKEDGKLKLKIKAPVFATRTLRKKLEE